MSGAPPSQAEEPLSPEERARANIYALLGRLFYAAPDAELIEYVCAAPAAEDAGASGELAQSWRKLQSECKAAEPGSVGYEHGTLFVGVGKSEVTPYTSHYAADSAPDRHLVALRDELARFGLARLADTGVVEDHIAGVCEVMRFLIENRSPLGEQRRFFGTFVFSAVPPLLDAVRAAPSARFYRVVAEFAQAFFDTEKTAFEIDAENVSET